MIPMVNNRSPICAYFIFLSPKTCFQIGCVAKWQILNKDYLIDSCKAIHRPDADRIDNDIDDDGN